MTIKIILKTLSTTVSGYLTTTHFRAPVTLNFEPIILGFYRNDCYDDQKQQYFNVHAYSENL